MSHTGSRTWEAMSCGCRFSAILTTRCWLSALRLQSRPEAAPIVQPHPIGADKVCAWPHTIAELGRIRMGHVKEAAVVFAVADVRDPAGTTSACNERAT